MSKYLIYYDYENLSLIDSSIVLLKELEIPFIDDNVFEYYGGHWGYVVNERIFFLSQAYNIALASSKDCDLLVLEEDAYYNLCFAKKHIEENPTLFNLAQSELAKYDLTYSEKTKIIYINNLLGDNLEKIKAKNKTSFSDFHVSIFHSSRDISDFDDKSNANLKKILNVVGLNIVYEEHNAFFQNELFSPKIAYKYSAKSLENAVDSGSDFILSNSMGIFDIFDKKYLKLSKVINRDFGNIPILFLPQVILLSFGIRDDTALALRYHKIGADFI
ncbi:hypothetical protein CCY99_06395 [Helicobacter sp. 16-1353]|uniref:HdrB C-terminal domain-containing protein n=1 Tax=Helicobacter sp. 16-1353 TaxID=2004996 RepID=UPI000DCE139C|nr:hypothetical protein [Helicobacter sp. 16-1353]RAX52994.1 hypothetical protein CCY99_06395 [Helicobacter sp. 16-1353]